MIKQFEDKKSKIVLGKIYTDDSNECFDFAERGECTAGSLCIYRHHGKIDHQEKKFCSRF